MERALNSHASKPTWPIWLKRAVYCVGGLLLAWRVLALGMADTTNGSDPEAALAWRPTQAAALASAAAEQFNSAKSPAQIANAERLAAHALSHGPLEASAVRTLGLSAALTGYPDRAASLLALAERMTLRDVPTQLWLLDGSVKRADYPGAVMHADVLMRTTPDNSQVETLLIQLASDPRAVAPLVAHLTANPDWRRSFLARLGAEVIGPDTPFMIFRALMAGHTPATAEETEPYFQRLVAGGLYQPAYLRWQYLFSPQGQPPHRPPYDGAFVGLPGPPPFNWRLSDQSDATAEFASRSDAGGDRGLHVAYNTSSSPEFARQLLLLSPGDYELSGRVSFDSTPEPNQLGWTVKCANIDQPLAQARDGGETGQWLDLTHSFTVPASNCDAQWLILDGRSGSEISHLSAWYSNLRISRRPSASPSAVTAGSSQ
jgi:hypothetical protein